MLQSNKVALFDFCETIANFQTADAYIDFVQSHSTQTNKSIRILYNILNKYHVLGIVRRLFPRLSIDKRLILRQMKGRTYEEMDEFAKKYYESTIKPNLIQPVVGKLKEMQNEGYEIVIVSGGYDIYLKYFALEYNIRYILSTTIEFNYGICSGKFNGVDCMRASKLDYIHSALIGDCKKWFAFSDSITDLPMLELVGNPIVVSKNKSQIWAERRGLKQIIWK